MAGLRQEFGPEDFQASWRRTRLSQRTSAALLVPGDRLALHQMFLNPRREPLHLLDVVPRIIHAPDLRAIREARLYAQDRAEPIHLLVVRTSVHGRFDLLRQVVVLFGGDATKLCG